METQVEPRCAPSQSRLQVGFMQLLGIYLHFTMVRLT